MSVLLPILASILVIDASSGEGGAVVSLEGAPADAVGVAAAPGVIQGEGENRSIDFRTDAEPKGLCRNFFLNTDRGIYETLPHHTRDLMLPEGGIDPCLFLRDTQRTFGSSYLPWRYCRVVKGGKASLARAIVRPDAFHCENFGYDLADDWDVLLNDTLIAGRDESWKRLLEIAFKEGFGPGNPDNWPRVLGLNETGTSNLDYPVLVDPRNLMVCALICDFLETVPEIYAQRSRVQPVMERQGFRFVFGTRLLKEGDSLPIALHQRLLENPEYRRGYADIVHEACVRTNGELSVESCTRRLNRRISEVRSVCGDDIDCSETVAALEAIKAKVAARSVDYVASCDVADLLTVPAPLATKADGVALPAYGRYRGKVSLELKPGVGKVYYSDNGCDPREEGGELNPLCTEYTGPFEVQGRCRLRARTLTPSGEWSALEMVNLNL